MVSNNSASDIYEIESKVLLSKKTNIKRRPGKSKSTKKAQSASKCATPLKSSPHISTWVGRNKGKLYVICLLSVVIFHMYGVMMKKLYAASAMIYNDYSDIQNQQSLEEITESIESLCNPGREKRCQCENPMEPAGRETHRHWLKTVQENKDAISSSEAEDVDIVFFGDSITEGWKGTSYGFENGRKENNPEVFKALFSVKDGAKYNGLPLGISGDRSPDLLWRLQNGELENTLNPKVFWLLIGTNDLGNSWCSPEATLLGILRVVEEIREKKPGVPIVINGLFPRSFHPKGYVSRKPSLRSGMPALWENIEDINGKLREYSDSHDNVEYFDVNDLFFVDSHAKKKHLKIDQNLMADFLHPSTVGYRLWGDAIVEKLDAMIH